MQIVWLLHDVIICLHAKQMAMYFSERRHKSKIKEARFKKYMQMYIYKIYMNADKGMSSAAQHDDELPGARYPTTFTHS